MAFQKKTWQFNDIITEGELNRMEEGIEEGITKAEQAGQVAQQAQQTANQAASDLAAHLNDKVTQQQGTHGLRVQNGKLEWQDGNEWKNIEIEIGGVENGQNANGHYVRFADGTQICWLYGIIAGVTPSTTTVQSLTIYYTKTTWTFPATFTTPPTVHFTVDVDGSGFLESTWVGEPTTTSCPYGFEAIKSFSGYNVHLIAIGRWK